jgi:hypothetical protein
VVLLLGFHELFLLDACGSALGFRREPDAAGVDHGKLGIGGAIFATYSNE